MSSLQSMKMLLCLCLGLVQKWKLTASNLKFPKTRIKCNLYVVCAEHRQVAMSGNFFSLIPWEARSFFSSQPWKHSTAWNSAHRCEAKMASAIAGNWRGHIQIVKMQKWSEVDSKNQSILHHGQCSRALAEKMKEGDKKACLADSSVYTLLHNTVFL